MPGRWISFSLALFKHLPYRSQTLSFDEAFQNAWHEVKGVDKSPDVKLLRKLEGGYEVISANEVSWHQDAVENATEEDIAGIILSISLRVEWSVPIYCLQEWL